MEEHILIVDDDARVLETFSRNLARSGHAVSTASGGDEAIDLFAQEHPDLVLVDVRMPQPDGFAVLKAIREEDPDAEVIMVTGHGDIDIAVEALRLGASDFLCKPVDSSDLEVAMERSRERLRLKRKLKEARSQLKEYAAELERSNRELEQFAYVASHDLRQPLRLVAGYVQLLGRRYAGQLDADADEFIAFALDGVARMDRLIQDLLAYSRVGRHPDRFSATDCAAVVDRVIATLGPMIEASDAVVTRDPLPEIVADEVQLEQLFQNLISNALKFQPPERLAGEAETPPRVHLGVERQERGWHFSVRDNGVGIDPQDSERIFAPFERLHTQQEYPGSGIGLAICKKVVENHGGTIGVTSRPGEGAIFHFTLPAGF